ncbi:hypothetical protein IEO21_07761 [Rhodonia placenta]|uniref:Semialdehyde dehydrogenase NAD-binding domain-containing protein n=1 Tax=Rhodonia placenta TaxID=104341 RepID=A0A8H7NXE9_9APHY|nr:hypothetical protein IEO21_07761 [Postia placenta]
MSKSFQTSVFFVGATGYIGGAVLTRILQHPDRPRLDITALVRSPEKAEKLEKLDITPVLGSLQDTGRLEDLASKADIVVACADADDLPAAQAILRGMARRRELTRDTPVLIHTIPVGVFSDNAAGMHPTSTIYSDADVEQMASLSPNQLHRSIDLAVLDADSKGTIKAYIVLPSTIWGLASGPLIDAQIANPHSQQIPMLIKASLARAQAGMVGEGKNLWPNVNIDEVADLFGLVFSAVRAGQPIGHGTDGYYIGENGEHMLYAVSRAIGEALVALGKASTDKVTTFSPEELDKYFGGSDYLGTNVRCRAEHSRAIGWKPVKTTRHMLASVKLEIEAILQRPEELKV